MYNIFMNSNYKIVNVFVIYCYYITLLLFGCCNTGQNNELNKFISVCHNDVGVHSAILIGWNLNGCQSRTLLLCCWFLRLQTLLINSQFVLCCDWLVSGLPDNMLVSWEEGKCKYDLNFIVEVSHHPT